MLLTIVSSAPSEFCSSCFRAADLRKAEAIEGLKLNTEGGGRCDGRLRSCGCFEVSQDHSILDLRSDI